MLRTTYTLRQTVLMLTLVIGSSAVVPLVGLAQSEENADAAKACAGGGYASLVRSEDGSRFMNAGECTEYAVKGGTLDRDDDGDGVPDSSDNCVGVVNPGQADTDGDGIGDGCDQDTDGDGLTDEDEVHLYSTNPLDTDTDGDELSDYDEVHVTRTDPISADSDWDGLTDYEELTIGTNPWLFDIDGDGVGDHELRSYGTSPWRADTDGDGVSDHDEIHFYGTDPLG